MPVAQLRLHVEEHDALAVIVKTKRVSCLISSTYALSPIAHSRARATKSRFMTPVHRRMIVGLELVR